MRIFSSVPDCYADPEVVKRRQATEADWLKKPYSTLELARTLREVLKPTIPQQGGRPC